MGDAKKKEELARIKMQRSEEAPIRDQDIQSGGGIKRFSGAVVYSDNNSGNERNIQADQTPIAPSHRAKSAYQPFACLHVQEMVTRYVEGLSVASTGYFGRGFSAGPLTTSP